MSAAVFSLSSGTYHKNKRFAREAGITIFNICLDFNKKKRGGESACVIEKYSAFIP